MIFFWDFLVNCLLDFDNFVKVFGYELFLYVGGVVLRMLVVGNVFILNEVLLDIFILFYYEMV